jgi:YHS domain-containing protein
MAIDPVCNKNVEPYQAAARVDYQGATYYFCSNVCHKVFTAAPEKYAKKIESGLPRAGGIARSAREWVSGQ